VDISDIKTIVFDIFSKRKKFVYDLKERTMLYLGFLGKAAKFCRCCPKTFKSMNHENKLFERAKASLEKECDIIELMDTMRWSKNYLKCVLERKQKLLLKFHNSNVIRINEGSSSDA